MHLIQVSLQVQLLLAHLRNEESKTSLSSLHRSIYTYILYHIIYIYMYIYIYHITLGNSNKPPQICPLTTWSQEWPANLCPGHAYWPTHCSRFNQKYQLVPTQSPTLSLSLSLLGLTPFCLTETPSKLDSEWLWQHSPKKPVEIWAEGITVLRLSPITFALIHAYALISHVQ